MDIAELIYARQRRIENIRDAITLREGEMAAEQEVYDELVRLSSQSTFTMAEINYLIDASN